MATLQCKRCTLQKTKGEYSQRQILKGAERKCKTCTIEMKTPKKKKTPIKTPVSTSILHTKFKIDHVKNWQFMYYDDEWIYRICNRLSVNTQYAPHLAVIQEI